MTHTGRLMNYYHTNANKVREFMESFGQEVKKEPQWPDEDTLNLRLDLIEEEYNDIIVNLWKKLRELDKQGKENNSPNEY